MSRTDKRNHQIDTTGARYGRTPEFSSPKARAAAEADRGHARMTFAEYLKIQPGRSRQTTTREGWLRDRIGARKVTRR